MPSKMSAAERNPLAKGCEGCYFLSNYFGCCNYLIFTDKRRPCPGGEGCTVKTTQTPESWEKVILWDTVQDRQGAWNMQAERNELREKALGG